MQPASQPAIWREALNPSKVLNMTKRRSLKQQQQQQQQVRKKRRNHTLLKSPSGIIGIVFGLNVHKLEKFLKTDIQA